MIKYDGRITVALIIALLIQAASAFVWVGQAQARLKALEQNAAGSPQMVERLARLEEQVGEARRSLNRIEQRLDAQ